MAFSLSLSRRFAFMVKEKTYRSSETEELLTDLRSLILFNDDHNTFDHVIDALIDVCEHNQHQAEQCALVAHFNGKCDIKVGTITELRPLHEELGRRDLTVEIK